MADSEIQKKGASIKSQGLSRRVFGSNSHKGESDVGNRARRKEATGYTRPGVGEAEEWMGVAVKDKEKGPAGPAARGPTKRSISRKPNQRRPAIGGLTREGPLAESPIGGGQPARHSEDSAQ